MRTLIENFEIAISSIFDHKLRSLLTMFGIVIGVGAVIGVVAIGRGGESMLKSNLAGQQENTLTIIYVPNTDDISFEKEPPAYFADKDIIALRTIDQIKQIYATNDSTVDVTYYQNESGASLKGIDMTYWNTVKANIVQGRAFTDEEWEGGKRVVIITERLARKLEEELPAIGTGSILYINYEPFEIAGIYAAKLESDLGIMMPRALWPVLYDNDHIQSVDVQTYNADQLELVSKKAVDVLNSTSTLDGHYEVVNQELFKTILTTVTRVMTSVVGGIASISLVVGGVGVMNMMLVSVTERTREIGIRKALGASYRNILVQFLIESMILTTLGGMAGIIIGLVFANVVAHFAKWPPLIDLSIIGIGVLFSMVIGIFFGLLPANRAARMKPIEALRYE
ncbi:ABC transporter permease [Paenibacillus sp. PL91]|uniref:ABC transporter permease n=1 Tax=Paenibacillus sp. PL91 TaxID=2729538 RepID=UPI00145F758A|nr:ABC transporter permease [Paenibacillus sp. PL91]MBC9201352.1 ABC transporter permease [Paenibacillus sp. PL91]